MTAYEHKHGLNDPIERERERIAAVSPEGRPANPRLRRLQMGGLILIFAIVMLITSLIVGTILSAGAGFVTAVIGLLVAIANPVSIAAILRGNERAQALDGSVK